MRPKIIADTALSTASAKEVLARTPGYPISQAKDSAYTNFINTQNKLAGLKSNEAQAYSDMFGTAYGKALPYTQTALEGVNSAASALGKLNPLRGISGTIENIRDEGSGSTYTRYKRNR
jgi:hypothetical protein